MVKKLSLFLLGVLVIFFTSCSKDEGSSNSDYSDDITVDSAIVEIIKNVSADSIEKYVQSLESLETRFALAPNRKEVALNILNKFKSFGLDNIVLDSFQLNQSYDGQVYYTWQYNVIATLEGSSYPDSICIIGGHHDCIVRSDSGNPLLFAPGANDNASGVATTLEVARVIKLVNFVPKSTIKFMTFAAEELGLYGSWDYACKAFNQGEKIKMMLNDDMVAYWSNPDTSNWCVNIIDYQNSTSLRLSAAHACALYTTLKTVNDNTYQKYSDSYPFSAYNYKAIFFISNADDKNYHTINDLTTACNFKFCREVAKVNCVLLIQDN
ncbi:MAG: M28 family metallopeptidase [Bacteroidales bacterium]